MLSRSYPNQTLRKAAAAVVTAAVDMTEEARRRAEEEARRKAVRAMLTPEGTILMELYDQCGYVHVTPPLVPPF